MVVGALLIAGGIGYTVRKAALDDTIALQATAGAVGGSAPGSPLGDTTTFRTVTQDTLRLLDAGDQAGATSRIDDLEYAWDQAQSVLKPSNVTAWNAVDGEIDTVLRELRATSPQVGSEKAALTALLGAL